jgi:hypothetical protein
MLIVALVLAVIGLAALVTAVVTSNELVAWVCIAASSLGVILLIVDAIRERRDRSVEEAEPAGAALAGTESVPETTAYADTDETADSTYSNFDADYPEDAAAEEHPEELVSDDPESDMVSDDEPEFSESAEEAAIHLESEADVEAESDEDVDEPDEAEAADDRGSR